MGAFLFFFEKMIKVGETCLQAVQIVKLVRFPDHQDIPDPVGDRFDFLEKTIEQLQQEMASLKKEQLQ